MWQKCPQTTSDLILLELNYRDPCKSVPTPCFTELQALLRACPSSRFSKIGLVNFQCISAVLLTSPFATGTHSVPQLALCITTRLLLQAQGFDEPAAVQWPSKHLSEFCEGAGFELGLVPHDTVLLPPSNNFYDNDAFSRLERSDAEQPLAAERAALERLLGLPDTGLDA